MSDTKDDTKAPSTPTDLPPPKPKTQILRPEIIAKQSTDKLIPGKRKTVRALKKTQSEKIRRVNKKLERLEKEKYGLKLEKHYATEAKKELETLASGKAESGIVDAKVFEHTTPTVKKLITEHEKVAFKPNPGPQTDFLAASEKEVLYGGARGGGKSYAMLIDPLRYFHNGNARALLLRRTMPEVRDLIHKSKVLYPQAFPKAKWREQEKEWIFPSGARMEFGYCESRDDVMRYQGQAYTWIGIDELAQFPTEDIVNDLSGSLRSIDTSIPTYMRFTANPGGPGHSWVKRRFIDPSPPNTSFHIEVPTAAGIKKISRKYIPAKLSDNPYLMQSDDYMIALANLPEHKRKQWLEGDWDVTEGAAFPEFDRKYHVVDPFDVPRTWPRFRAADWGYSSPACVLWFAVDYDNTLFVYREYYGKGLDADRFAAKIMELEAFDPKPINGIMDSSLWAKRGDSGPSIIETMAKRGCRWRPSDRSPGSRLAGKLEVHRRLRIEDGRTKLKIFSTCTNLISTLPVLPTDPSHMEDVDTKAEDHAYDALRYGVMSRPLNASTTAAWTITNTSKTYKPSDPVFGY
jgi:hypothetical protein